MSPLSQQIITVVLIFYVLWMLVAGRTLIWSDGNHPNVFLLNTRWVFRDEERALYWGSAGLHMVLVGAMAYIAFVQ